MLILLGLIGVLFYWILIPSFVSPRMHADSIEILHNLCNLDEAKAVWALENSKTGIVEVTRENIAPYLRNSGWVRIVAHEQYTLNRLEEPAEALLTRRIGRYPAGTILRWGSDG